MRMILADYSCRTRYLFLKQLLSTNLGNVFIQVIDLQVLLGRIFIELNFSKPKSICLLLEAKSIIRKFVAIVDRDVSLS